MRYSDSDEAMNRRCFFRFLAGAAAWMTWPKTNKPIGPKRGSRDAIEAEIIKVREKIERDLRTMNESLGSGVLDTVQCCYGNTIAVNSTYFYPNQRIEIYSATDYTKRGSRKVVSIADDRIVLDSRVPGDTKTGDLIVLPPMPLPLFVVDSSIGTYKGLSRS